MDKLSGLASKFGGGSSNSSTSHSNQSSSGKEDYLDKAVSAVQSKFGGGKTDPAKTRSTNEKFTDGARERFEKATGKKVPEKFSN